MDSEWTRKLLLLFVVLLIPVIPFLAFGHVLEPWVNAQMERSLWKENPIMTGWVVIGLLISDILLPIPSSNVCTFAGAIHGYWVGTLVAWCGLNLSCALGYGLAYWFGWPLASRLSGQNALADMQRQVQRFGIAALVIFRAVPVLAEASVVLMGVYRMKAMTFWPPVLAANLGIAIAYAVMGSFASEHGWLGLAMSIALAFPLALTGFWWIWRSRRSH